MSTPGGEWGLNPSEGVDRHLGFLFTSEGRKEQRDEPDNGRSRKGTAFTVPQCCDKRELSQKAELSIHRSAFFPTLVYGHDMQVMTHDRKNNISDTSRQKEFSLEDGWHLPKAVFTLKHHTKKQEAKYKSWGRLRLWVAAVTHLIGLGNPCVVNELWSWNELGSNIWLCLGPQKCPGSKALRTKHSKFAVCPGFHWPSFVWRLMKLTHK